jgi:hypothetical protein
MVDRGAGARSSRLPQQSASRRCNVSPRLVGGCVAEIEVQAEVVLLQGLE